MNRIVSILLTLSFVITLLAGCTTAAPAPTAAPTTKAPVATTAPAATAAPAATTAPAAATKAAAASTPAAAATGKRAVVALVPGGPHPYFNPWKDGLADAMKDFGIQKAEFRSPQEWSLNAQNQVIDSMVAQGFNAFGIFPGDVNGSNGKIDELAAKGIPTLTLAGPVNEPTKAPFCPTTDVGDSAYQATKFLIQAMGGKGNIVHGTGFLVDPNTQLRIAAVEKAVAETNGAVKLVQNLADIDDQEKADKAINSFFAANKDKIDGIVTTAYVPTVVAATTLRNLGDKRIKMVGIDDDKIVLDAIKDGFVYGTMAQNPYGQAYVGAYVLDLLTQGWKKKAGAPYKIDSGTLLISAKNLTTYPDELKTITKQLQSTFKDKYLTAP
ncbi:MAG: substrate-binding domain-containing protein [Chloroflexota bacterium]